MLILTDYETMGDFWKSGQLIWCKQKWMFESTTHKKLVYEYTETYEA